MADFSPLGHKLPTANEVDPRQTSMAFELRVLSQSSALLAFGIGPAIAKSHLSSLWTISEGEIVLWRPQKT